MTDERWKQLSDSDNWDLDPSEIAEGWHWCYEFNGLLVGPCMSELNFCACWPENHPVYATAPAQTAAEMDL